MLSICDRPTKLSDGLSRRELLRIGGLGMLGASLPSLLQAARRGNSNTDAAFGRAKNVIFLYLAGGPPQHETFDPKPDAPAEVRGPFKPISTNIPGIQYCELLPRTAAIADKLAVVRSMATDDNTHSSSSHWVLTGYKYQGPNPRTIQPTDWPYLGSIVKRYKPSDKMPALSTVWLPDMMRLNESVTPAGQTGGLMGPQWDPERFVGDPSQPDYRIEGLVPRGIPPLRLQNRQALLSQFQEHLRSAETAASVKLLDTYQQQAFDLMTSGKAQQAFAIQQEPAAVRERYGKNRWGQCVLLARRLIEAGVRLVHVQWPREPGDNAVDNPLWDTHAQNPDRLEDVLCPMFDVGFTALVEDLDQRGLLEETLVVAIGEFGRTPKINPKAGRDHWGPVFSFAMAGAGISGGQVYGSSDKDGAYPASDRVEPGNLTATIFHLLGLDHRGTFTDPQGRELALTQRPPLYPLLGNQSATSERTESTGDVARVPPFDPARLLVDPTFAARKPLAHVSAPSRPKGWRAAPKILSAQDDVFGARVLSSGKIEGVIDQHIAIGFNLATGSAPLRFAPGMHAYIAQEVRSPFAGTYSMTVRACGEASSPEFYQEVFLKHFATRLVFFQYTDKAKKPTQRRETASVSITPKLRSENSSAFQEFTLTKQFINPTPGGNFSFGLGMGVAIIVEKTSPGMLQLPAGESGQRALIRINSVDLVFQGKERNEKVVV
jgi:hypothetical protein